jgi:glycosyltransferase involved in cell wall biosynthesis
MNILHITSHLGGGAGLAISGMCLFANYNHCDVKVVLLDTPKDLFYVNLLRQNNIDVEQFSVQLEEWADVLCINWFGGNAMENFLQTYKFTKKVVAHLHTNGFHQPPLESSNIIKIADKVFITSPYSLEHKLVPKDAVVVYGYGNFDPSKMMCKADYYLSDDTFNIGYCGSPSFKKLRFDFPSYCKGALQAVPNVRFTLIGENNDEFANAMYELVPKDKVRFLGKIRNVNDELLKLDCIAHLLSDETFSTTENSALEAMATGLPLIMPIKPLGQYFIEDKENGFLVESPEQFAKYIKLLYDDYKLREQIGKAARETVIKNVNAKENAHKFYEGIKELVSYAC